MLVGLDFHLPFWRSGMNSEPLVSVVKTSLFVKLQGILLIPRLYSYCYIFLSTPLIFLLSFRFSGRHLRRERFFPRLGFLPLKGGAAVYFFSCSLISPKRMKKAKERIETRQFGLGCAPFPSPSERVECYSSFQPSPAPKGFSDWLSVVYTAGVPRSQLGDWPSLRAS